MIARSKLILAWTTADMGSVTSETAIGDSFRCARTASGREHFVEDGIVDDAGNRLSGHDEAYAHAPVWDTAREINVPSRGSTYQVLPFFDSDPLPSSPTIPSSGYV